jgi:hypothetical protein
MKSGPAILILSLLLGGCSVLRDVIPSASKERKCKGVLGCGSFEELQYKRVFDIWGFDTYRNISIPIRGEKDLTIPRIINERPTATER